MAGEDRDNPRIGRNPHGDGSISSPDTAARPPALRIQRNCRLRTIFRIDPKVGVGIYTESAKIKRLLESSGLPVAAEGDGAYCVVPADRVALVADVLAMAFPARA